jgi:MarR family transcriptional regulator, organic hydroperoxide resistance regulator
MTATRASQPATTPAAPAQEDPLSQVGRSFKAAMGAVRRLRGRETQLDQLSYAQYGLLFGLADQPEMSASRLAEVADLTPATVTQMLDHLEADGLVARTRSERDKRVVLVTLTEPGRKLIASRRTRFERLWREALAEFDDEQLRSAAAVLDRLRAMFDDFPRDQVS